MRRRTRGRRRPIRSPIAHPSPGREGRLPRAAPPQGMSNSAPFASRTKARTQLGSTTTSLINCHRSREVHRRRERRRIENLERDGRHGRGDQDDRHARRKDEAHLRPRYRTDDRRILLRGDPWVVVLSHRAKNHGEVRDGERRRRAQPADFDLTERDQHDERQEMLGADGRELADRVRDTESDEGRHA